jgi:photosystem II stability/assembly factor-like uncharacterized protein
MIPRFSPLLSSFCLLVSFIVLEAQNTIPLNNSFSFRSLGPTRGGRVTTVTGHADVPHLFFFGATGGGVWKSINFGQNWYPVSDKFFKSPSIGAIRMAPSNPNIIYAGTGSDGIRSNVIAGKGVYKSLDQGESWTFIGLEKTAHIGAIEINPSNADIAYVAAIGNAFAPNEERGVFKTDDGGNHWKKVLYLNDSIGFSDLELHPINANIIYACSWRVDRKPWTIISGTNEGGIYRSIDAGNTWIKLDVGLPNGFIGKIDLAITPASPDRIYALIEAENGSGGVYLSENKGDQWIKISSFSPLLDRPFYYCNIDVHPMHPDWILVNATSFWSSKDLGKTWQSLHTPHGDNHDIWINPKQPDIWIQSNDGGANVTRNAGQTWSPQDNQSTAELYQVDIDDQFPYWLYAGQQDNTTIALPVLPPYNALNRSDNFWIEVGGCETGPAVPVPGNPDLVYANCKGRFGVFNKKTGQEMQYYIGASNIYGHDPDNLTYRFQRVTPIEVSPFDPNIVYYGSQYLHKTLDGGKSWQRMSPDLTARTPETQVISGGPITRDITGEEYYSSLYDIAVSPLEMGVIYTGSNDGPIHLTRDEGKTWKNITPLTLPPGGKIDCIEPSVYQKGKAYFSVLRYQLGDWKPYIYKTVDYGNSWQLLTNGENGIPSDYPVRVVREDPKIPGILYAGTEYGLYISLNDGESWFPFQLNLPITPISDIKIKDNDLVLSTMGRGFYVFDNIQAIRSWKKIEKATEFTFLKPEPQYRMRYQASSTDELTKYPDPSVFFEYFIPVQKDTVLSLKITDDKGRLVRQFSSADEKYPDNEESSKVDMATGFQTKGFMADLKIELGIHRFSWDMRYTGFGANGKNGILAAPGNYLVEFTYGKKTYAQYFQLLIDPRLPNHSISTEMLKQQVELSLLIRDLEWQAKDLASMIKKLGASLDKQSKAYAFCMSLENELITSKSVAYSQPMLIDQIGYLREMLNTADQIPGKDAYDRYHTLKLALDNLLRKWENKLNIPGFPN